MRITVITPAPTPLEASVSQLIDGLRRAGHEVEEAPSLIDAERSQAYLLVGIDRAPLAAELTATREKAADRLRRVILVGVRLDFHRGIPVADPGSFIELLEDFQLAGAFDAEALSSWQEVPSPFAGPKTLMSRLNSNALKVFQSRTYANWFAGPGNSFEEFLVRYVSVLDHSLSEGEG
jgi:hypothetical protein